MSFSTHADCPGAIHQLDDIGRSLERDALLLEREERRRPCVWSPAGRSFSVSCGTGVSGIGSLYVILHRFPELLRRHFRGVLRQASPAYFADDSVWPNLYLSIIAPTPGRSTSLSATSSRHTTLARPPNVPPGRVKLANSSLSAAAVFFRLTGTPCSHNLQGSLVSPVSS